MDGKKFIYIQYNLDWNVILYSIFGNHIRLFLFLFVFLNIQYFESNLLIITLKENTIHPLSTEK